jgi:hypothetical protein
MENLKRMMSSQTFQPEITEIIDYAPESNECDITPRYRRGYDRMRNRGLDVIALMEVDDYYAPEYLETMVAAWESAGRPDLFGTDYTIYYNIRVWGFFTMNHIERSSAMSTLIRPDMNFPWCVDNEPFTDMWLWNLTDLGAGMPFEQRLKGKVFKPHKHICIGIKHGVGKLGGRSHVDRLERYTHTKNGTEDPSKSYLRSFMDEESFEFYSNYFENEKDKQPIQINA